MDTDILASGTLTIPFLTALLLGLIAPLVGLFLVIRRFSLLADTLAHVSLLGVAVSSWFGSPMTTGALLSAVLGGLGIEALRQSRRVLSEATLAIFLSGSLAIAITLFAIRGIDAEEIEAYLFGNLAAVTLFDFSVLLMLAIALGGFFLTAFEKLFLASLDEDLAQVNGVAVKRVNFLFMFLASTVVAIAIKVVGVLLVSALVVLPAMAALQWRQGFKRTLLINLGLSEVAVILGFALAYYGALPSGAAIALVSLSVFVLSYGAQWFRR
jgi:zinc transport system permease protein